MAEEMNLFTQYHEIRAKIADDLRGQGKKPREVSAVLRDVIPLAIRSEGVSESSLHAGDEAPTTRWDATDAFGVGPENPEGDLPDMSKLEANRLKFQKGNNDGEQ